MRIRAGWALAVLLAAGLTVRADDQDAARAVIAEAIRAHGGADALAKTQVLIRKSSGRMTVEGKEVPFTEESTAQGSDRWRRETELRPGSQKLRLLVVLNGEKGWQTTAGPVADISPARLKELREDAYAQWLTTLLPLTRESSLQLAQLAESKVNNEPARGVQVSSKGHADVKLYFDAKTHLLVKMERQAAEAGAKVVREETYSAHKDFDGVRLPTKIVQTVGGKKLSETAEVEYTVPRKLEEASFGKP
jgi:hypothetical protein